MKKFCVEVLFFTGFNHFYDKIVAKEIVTSASKEDALEQIKKKFPYASDDFVRKNLPIEGIILNKWEREFKYEITEI